MLKPPESRQTSTPAWPAEAGPSFLSGESNNFDHRTLGTSCPLDNLRLVIPSPFFIILILGFLFQEVFFSSRLQLPPTEVPFFWSFKFEVRPLPGPIFHRVGRVPAGSRCPSLQDTFVATKPVGNSPGRGTLKPYFSFTFQILVQPPYRLVALNILLNQTY